MNRVKAICALLLAACGLSVFGVEPLVVWRSDFDASTTKTDTAGKTWTVIPKDNTVSDGQVTIGSTGMVLKRSEAFDSPLTLVFRMKNVKHSTTYNWALAEAQSSNGRFDAFLTTAGKVQGGYGGSLFTGNYTHREGTFTDSTDASTERYFALTYNYKGDRSDGLYLYEITGDCTELCMNGGLQNSGGNTFQYFDIGGEFNGETATANTAVNGAIVTGAAVFNSRLAATDISSYVNGYTASLSAAGGSWSTVSATAFKGTTLPTTDVNANVVINVSEDATLTIDSAVTVSNVTFNISKGKTLTLANSNSATFTAGGLVSVSGEGTLVANMAIAGKVDIGAAATVISSSASSITSFTGSGVLKCSGFLPSTAASAAFTKCATNTAWTGTVWVYNCNSSNQALYPHYWGNSGSKLKFTSIKGYIPVSGQLGFSSTESLLPIGELILEDEGSVAAYEESDGYGGYNTKISKLSGSGTWKYTKSNTQRIIIVDGADFKGTINLASGGCFIFGTSTDNIANKTINVRNSVVIAEDKTWSASVVVYNGGTLKIEQDAAISGALTIKSGAVLDLSGDTAPSATSLTVEAAPTVKLTAAPTTAGTKVVGGTVASTAQLGECTVYVNGTQDTDNRYVMYTGSDGLYVAQALDVTVSENTSVSAINTTIGSCPAADITVSDGVVIESDAEFGVTPVIKADSAVTASIRLTDTQKAAVAALAQGAVYKIADAIGVTPTLTNVSLTFTNVPDGYLTTTEDGFPYITKKTNSISIKTSPASATEGRISSADANVGGFKVGGGAWNHTKYYTGTQGGTTEVMSVKDGNGTTLDTKVFYYMPNMYDVNCRDKNGRDKQNTGNGKLTYSYFDDSVRITPTSWPYEITDNGVTYALPKAPGPNTFNLGWEIGITNIPYQVFDLYIYQASDQTASSITLLPIAVKANDGEWKFFAGDGSGSTVAGNYNTTWDGASYCDSETMTEGTNYIRYRFSAAVLGLASGTKIEQIFISHPSRSDVTGRLGLAGIQIVEVENDGYYKRDASASTTGWLDEGTWVNSSGSNVSWSNPSGTDVSYATIDGDSVTEIVVNGEVVATNIKLSNTVEEGKEKSFTFSKSGDGTLTSPIDASDFHGQLNLGLPVTGAIALAGDATMVIDISESDETFANILTGGTLQKKGTATLTCSGALSGTKVDIVGGTVKFTGTTSSVTLDGSGTAEFEAIPSGITLATTWTGNIVLSGITGAGSFNNTINSLGGENSLVTLKNVGSTTTAGVGGGVYFTDGGSITVPIAIDGYFYLNNGYSGAEMPIVKMSGSGNFGLYWGNLNVKLTELDSYTGELSTGTANAKITIGTVGTNTMPALGDKVLKVGTNSGTIDVSAMTVKVGDETADFAYEVRSDGVYAILTEANTYAKIGTARYASLSAALDEAKAGDTVEMTQDATIEGTLTISKAITLDLGTCALAVTTLELADGVSVTGTGTFTGAVKSTGTGDLNLGTLRPTSVTLGAEGQNVKIVLKSGSESNIEIPFTGTIGTVTVYEPDGSTVSSVSTATTEGGKITVTVNLAPESLSRTNPVTGDAQGFTWAFRDTTDSAWGTVGNWYTLSDRRWVVNTATTAPGVSNATASNPWAPMLFDGDLITNDNNSVSSSGVEGWNPKYGAFNGAKVSISTKKLQQGDNGVAFVMVDKDSKITFSSVSGGNTQGTTKFYVAAADGVEFSGDLTASGVGGTCTPTFDYFLKGDGSVKYVGAVAGTHNLSNATFSVGSGDYKTILSKTLIGFGTNSGTFNVDNATITCTDEGVTATKKSSVAPGDAVGSYALSVETKGVKLTYVGYTSSSDVVAYRTVTEDETTQKVGYWTLTGALAAASGGETVTLLKTAEAAVSANTGSASSPVILSMTDKTHIGSSTITLGSGAGLKLAYDSTTCSGNRTIKVKAAEGYTDKPTVIISGGDNWGMDNGSNFSNVKLVLDGVTKLWIEANSTAEVDSSVDLELKSGASAVINSGVVNIGNLSGAGSFVSHGTESGGSLCINMTDNCTFAGGNYYTTAVKGAYTLTLTGSSTGTWKLDDSTTLVKSGSDASVGTVLAINEGKAAVYSTSGDTTTYTVTTAPTEVYWGAVDTDKWTDNMAVYADGDKTKMTAYQSGYTMVFGSAVTVYPMRASGGSEGNLTSAVKLRVVDNVTLNIGHDGGQSENARNIPDGSTITLGENSKVLFRFWNMEGKGYAQTQSVRIDGASGTFGYYKDYTQADSTTGAGLVMGAVTGTAKLVINSGETVAVTSIENPVQVDGTLKVLATSVQPAAGKLTTSTEGNTVVGVTMGDYTVYTSTSASNPTIEVPSGTTTVTTTPVKTVTYSGDDVPTVTIKIPSSDGTTGYDVTKYYTKDTSVSGTITFTINTTGDDSVVPAGASMTSSDNGGVAVTPSNVKAGFYYGLCEVSGSGDDATVVNEPTSYTQATSDGQTDLRLTNDATSESKVRYYRIAVKDTAQ